MNEKRIDYIDELRGLAIMLVVIGHLIQFNGLPNNNPVFEFIYSFHMPLFFAISGYITQKVTKILNLRQYLVFLKKKFIALIIPLFTWSLIVNPFFLSNTWKLPNISLLWDVITSPGLWFLKMLFVILMLYGIYNWISNLLKLKAIFNFTVSIIPSFILSLALIYIEFMEINLVMFSFAFFLGVVISRYELIEKISLNSISYTLSIFIFLILSTHWNFNGNYIDDIYKIIVSTAAFIMLLNIFTKIKINKSIKNCFQIFGKYSLSIYVIQFYLCNLSLSNFANELNNINSLILFFICFVISIPICYICVSIAKIIETNKICSFLMLGKRIK